MDRLPKLFRWVCSQGHVTVSAEKPKRCSVESCAAVPKSVSLRG